MEFRDFIERNDLSVMQTIYADVQKSIEALIDHYRQFYELHFRKIKRNEDEHDYFMNLRGMPERWRNKFPRIYDYMIDIRRRSTGAFTRLTGSELSGEFDGSYIILYSNEIPPLVQELEFFANNFAWLVHDHKDRKASAAKKDAKIIHEKLLLLLEQNKEKLSNVLYHEIVHASRHAQIKDPQIPLSKATPQHIMKTYVNNPPELDAYFLTIAHRILQSRERYENFSEFLNKFREMIGKKHFDLLTEKNKRKMVGRLYQLYSQNS